jgi:uncharacterized delta-60 repeat protein
MKSSIYKIRTFPFKILVGGFFTSFNNTTQHNIVRLNSDGTRDTSFNAGGGFNNGVYAFAVQSDGKILVGGSYSSFNGTSENNIVRLNSDGTRDTSFVTGTGFDGPVSTIAIQSDGKIVVGGGGFTSYNGTGYNRIIRLNSDGTRDTSFTVGTGFDYHVYAIAIQLDGKILVGGYFTAYNGTTQNCMTRLNSDGTLDTGFTFTFGNTDFLGEVYAVAVQSNGKILIGGDLLIFDEFGNLVHIRIARLNFDGSRDTSFNAGGFDERVYTIAIQSDGKIVVGGVFGRYDDYVTYDSTSLDCIARLNSDGTPDTGFTAGFGGQVNAIAIQSDGKIIIGGGFTDSITRLNADGTIDTSFVIGTGFNNSVFATSIS